MERRSFLGALAGLGAALGLVKKAVAEEPVRVDETWDAPSGVFDARYTDEQGRVFQLVTRSRGDSFQMFGGEGVGHRDIRGEAVFWKHDEERTGVVTAKGKVSDVAGIAHSSIAPGHQGFIQVGGPTRDMIYFRGAPIHADLYIPGVR